MKQNKTLSFSTSFRGEIQYNLNNRRLNFIHLDFKRDTAHFPFSISHIYQRNTIDYGYGKGFKLNLEQTLSKIKGTSKYKLTLPNGNEEIFEERYYYIDLAGYRAYRTPNGKILSREDITVEADGSLTYDNYPIHIDLRTETGLTLKSDYNDFINPDAIDFRNEELVSLEQEITQINQTLQDLAYQYQEYQKYDDDPYKALANAKKDYQEASQALSNYQLNSLNVTEKEEYLQAKQKSFEKTKRCLRWIGGLKSEEKYVNSATQIAYDGSMDRFVYEDYDGYNAERMTILNKYLNNGFNNLTDKEKLINYYSQQFSDSVNEINQRIQELALQIEKTDLEYQKELSKQQKDVSTKESALLEAQNSYDNSELDRIKEYYALLEKRTELQIEEYQALLNQKKYQRKELLKQIPELFLFDENGMAYGFNAYGKLSMLFDAYGHKALIEYNSLDQIQDVIDSENHKIEFIYNEQNQLIRIIDDEGDYLEFEYESGNLTRFIYPDQKVFNLKYSLGYLEEVIDTDAVGYKITHLEHQIESIAKTSRRSSQYKEADKISFSYLEHQIIVQNQDTLLNTHYVFDETNELVTEYSEIDEKLEHVTVYDSADKFSAYSTVEKHCSLVMNSNKNDQKILDVIPGKITGIKTYTVPTLNGFATDYVLYASVKAYSYNILKTRITPFCNHIIWTESENIQFALTCHLVYDDYTVDYIASFNPNIKEKQFVALPIPLRREITGKVLPKEIVVGIDYTGNQGVCEVYNITMAQGEFRYCEYNEAHHKIFESFSQTFSSKTANFETKGQYMQKKEIRYFYNPKEQLEKKEDYIDYQEYDLSGNFVKSDSRYIATNYTYNQQNKIVRQKDNLGNVIEYEYTEHGDCIRKKSYSEEMPNMAYIQEIEVDENGKTLSETNELGYKNSYQYLNRSPISVTTPNGNLLSMHSSDLSESISIDVDGVENYTTKIINGNENTIYKTDGMSYELINSFYDGFEGEKKFYINNKVYCKFIKKKLPSKIIYQTIFEDHTGYEKVTDLYDKILEINRIVSDKTFPYIVYSYDDKDRLIKETCYKDNQEQVIEYLYVDDTLTGIKTNQFTKAVDYNLCGNTESILYQIDQDKYKTNFTYDALDRLTGFMYTKNNDISLIEEYQYDVLNRIIESNHPIIKNKYSYLSKNGRTTNLISTNQKKINGGYQRHSYQYDKEGNIINKLENHISTHYTYDSLNRLIREDNEELNQTILYTYDGNGNLQTKEIYDYTLTDNLENKTIIEYNYNDFNDYLTRFDGKDIRYDSLGNPIVYKDIPLVWNHKELKKYGTIEFRYNGNHIRTKKITNGKSIEYIVDGSRILKEKIEYYPTHLESYIDEYSTIDTDREEIEYIYGNQGIIGFDHIKGDMKTRYYYNKNILGDILEIYSEYRQLVGKYSYDAYGNHKILIDINHIATLNPFRYRSYYYDQETNLYYLNSRYYDPEVCRFISMDSIEYMNPDTINGLNLYAYCGNNPVMNLDPDGQFPFLAVILCGLALIGMGLTIGGVASNNNTLTAVGLTMVAVPALISGGMAIAAGIAGATLTGIVGGVTLVAGIGTGVFASAEIQQASGNGNWMLDAGMSEDWYNGLMLTTAAIATAGTFASSFCYNFNIKSLDKIGRLVPSNHPNKGYWGIRFKDARGALRSVEIQNHVPHGLHFQLNSWNPMHMSVKTIRRWTWFLTRI